ncbi:MAG: DUF427 domain-containing protein [Betaproteobacteria bacterium]|nr:DUF427 domain-containing protein [Betaproteobacteria bacterium]MDH5219975.1 DUF427 domain-containing protein [Betaproteobacteria bacterium]MDH5349655.1 DUF427 domain-containing protein [Betaproteobacteria bacterium]
MANPAPGFQKVPRSHIATRPAGRRVRVTLGGEVLAESREAVELLEGGHAPVYYLPRKDVRMGRLIASPHTTYCPYKGTASYFSVAGGPENAAWSYEQPYDEMQDIRALLAFYPRKVDAITISDD